MAQSPPMTDHNAASGERPELSVVAPMYNEEDNIEAFFAALMPVLEGLGLSYEVVCIDDGSTDSTLEKLLAVRAMEDRVKVVSLSRNFGKDMALSAGLDYASGDAVVPIDTDLQDPPELIAEMIATWRQGYDVVYAVRASRRHSDSALKRGSASLFYRTFNLLVDTNIPRDTGDFRLMDRAVVVALRQLPERTRFMKGLFTWVGFRQTGIAYERKARHAGDTKWGWWRLWNFALDGITSFSTLPLRFWAYLGLVISALSFVYLVFLIIRVLISGIDVPGYASLMVVVLFLGGLQMLTLGIFGEYLGRLFDEVKGRPLYIVRRRYGFDPDG